MRGPIYQAGAVFRQPLGANAAVLAAEIPRVFHLLLQVGADPFSADFSHDFGIPGSPNAAGLATSVTHTINESVTATSPNSASMQTRTCF